MEREEINEIMYLDSRVSNLSWLLDHLRSGETELSFVMSGDQHILKVYSDFEKALLSELKEIAIKRIRIEWLEAKEKLEKM